MLGIPFTGPGIAACALCTDKGAPPSTRCGRPGCRPRPGSPSTRPPPELGAGEALGRGWRSGSGSRWSSSRAAAARLSASGSPPGADEVPAALVAAFSYDDRVLLERFVDGASWRSACSARRALPVVEAIPEGGDRYDFEARYEIGRTRFECPAELERRRRRP